MSTMASQITGVSIVYSAVYSGPDQRLHQSSALLAFVRGIHSENITSYLVPWFAHHTDPYLLHCHALTVKGFTLHQKTFTGSSWQSRADTQANCTIHMTEILEQHRSINDIYLTSFKVPQRFHRRLFQVCLSYKVHKNAFVLLFLFEQKSYLFNGKYRLLQSCYMIFYFSNNMSLDTNQKSNLGT